MPTGVYKRTKEHNFRISEGLKGKSSGMLGKKHTVETKRKMSEVRRGKYVGKNSPLWGRNLSQKTKLKISTTNKRIGVGKWMNGKKHTEKTKHKISVANSGSNHYFWGKKHTMETKKKMSRVRMGKHRGEKHPNWRDGASSLQQRIRGTRKYVEWRQSVFLRDDFTCVKCGDRGGILNAHHLKSFKKLLEEVKQNLPLFGLYDGAMVYSPLWDTSNGVTLCEECHKKLNSLEGK